MKEVTKKEMWDFVKDRDVVFSAQGSFPFTGVWTIRNTNIVVAKQVPIGRHLGISTDEFQYFIYK